MRCRNESTAAVKRGVSLLCWTFLLVAAWSVHAATPAWKPTQNIEIIVPAAAGGANDLTGRLVQRTLQDARLVEYSIAVVNKPGGGHTMPPSRTGAA